MLLPLCDQEFLTAVADILNRTVQAAEQHVDDHFAELENQLTVQQQKQAEVTANSV